MRVRRLSIVAPAVVGAASLTLLASGSAFADQYDAPANYYSTANGLSGAALKSQLYTITSTGFIGRSYGDARYSMAITDRDPNNASKILLVYNRASVSGTWDFGETYNREHVWPKSLLNLTSSQVSNSYTGIASDMFELRPSNPNINSNRLNYGYGSVNAAKPAAGYGIVNANGTFWYPGDADRGDVARSIFYMATRYGQGQSHNITLVNGAPGTYQMGDKESLLHWMYEDPVDNFERYRNQAVYSQALNPQYYQNNRNPFIDHPEYVWSIFGTGANTSTLSVGSAAADGTSTTTADLGKVIAGSSFGTQSLSLSKSGSTPTTYDVTATGSASSAIVGVRQSFAYDAQSRSFTVGLNGSTATTGLRTGSIVIDNTDLTANAATGQGAADGNDTINVTGVVVSHARPSVAVDQDLASQTIDLGIVARGSSGVTGTFSVANRGVAGEYVAGLDIDGFTASGDTAAFSTDLATSSNLAVGDAKIFNVTPDTTTLGTHAATFTINTSDEDIAGATSLASLAATISARIAIGGDTSLDDAVNFTDLVTVAQNYNHADTLWQTGDFNRSGNTDFSDLVILAQNYNTSAAGLSQLSGLGSDFAADFALAQALVPEPIVVLPAMFALALVRRRK